MIGEVVGHRPWEADINNGSSLRGWWIRACGVPEALIAALVDGCHRPGNSSRTTAIGVGLGSCNTSEFAGQSPSYVGENKWPAVVLLG